jgi:hypothetical protein
MSKRSQPSEKLSGSFNYEGPGLATTLKWLAAVILALTVLVIATALMILGSDVLPLAKPALDTVKAIGG